MCRILPNRKNVGIGWGCVFLQAEFFLRPNSEEARGHKRKASIVLNPHSETVPSRPQRLTTWRTTFHAGHDRKSFSICGVTDRVVLEYKKTRLKYPFVAHLRGAGTKFSQKSTVLGQVRFYTPGTGTRKMISDRLSK